MPAAPGPGAAAAAAGAGGALREPPARRADALLPAAGREAFLLQPGGRGCDPKVRGSRVSCARLLPGASVALGKRAR